MNPSLLQPSQPDRFAAGAFMAYDNEPLWAIYDARWYVCVGKKLPIVWRNCGDVNCVRSERFREADQVDCVGRRDNLRVDNQRTISNAQI